jgi:hypothetical protein
VDLSRAVIVGVPVKKSILRWSVPYDVTDAAGNAATTVWRDIVVEEVDLLSVEAKIREEILHQKNAEIQKAVDKALSDDRKSRERGAVNARDRKSPVSCPDCPKCDSSGKMNQMACQAVCDLRMKTCAIDKESLVVRILIWLERLFPPSMVPVVLTCTAVMIAFLILRWILTLLFNPQAYHRSYYDDIERERALMNAVVYHRGAAVNGLNSTIHGSTIPTENINGHFSPQSKNPVTQSASSMNSHNQLQGEDFTDIYQSPIITPSKRGDGVRRRSPYSVHGRSSM